MLDKSLKNEWGISELRRNIVLVRGETLQKEMLETSGMEAPFLKMNQEYPIYKTVGGVRIESGFALLFPCSLQEMLTLLGDFLDKKHKEAFQNFEALCSWAEFFGWPVPDSRKCGGYVLNHELVRFTADEKGSSLIFKYKDAKDDAFFLYTLWFLAAGRNCYFFIRRLY